MSKEEIIFCKDCKYFKPFKDAKEYGTCQSKHTFDGAFKSTDYCSYALYKGRKINNSLYGGD